MKGFSVIILAINYVYTYISQNVCLQYHCIRYYLLLVVNSRGTILMPTKCKGGNIYIIVYIM